MPAAVEASTPKVSVLSTPTPIVFRVANSVNENTLGSSITVAAQQDVDPLVIVVAVLIGSISFFVLFVIIRCRRHRLEYQSETPH
ncbi:MAG: hypothetical protein CUN53_01555 [Phototrophicales bacterium]|nr:MAG: hypothetical protein CUN53_01555 [Phototrophicales bacterium]